MTRLRISDPTLMDDFAEFLARSGFVVVHESDDTVRLGLPLTPGPTRTEADIQTLLDVWLVVGLRIWRDSWPDADVIALGQAQRASGVAGARSRAALAG